MITENASRNDSRSGLRKKIDGSKSKAKRKPDAQSREGLRLCNGRVPITISLVAALTAYIAYYLTWRNNPFGSSADSEHWPSIRNEAFDVVDIPGRGKGIIASRDIKQGELLIKERPLILLPSSTSSSPFKLIKDRLSTLTESERNGYYSLSYVVPHRDPDTPLSDDDVTLAIFQTNAIAAGGNVGLFPRTARMNHACSAAFNSVYSWRPQEGYLVVHALKAISRGQELLTTYTDTKKPRHERQSYLNDFYDFTCSCSICSLPEADSARSDERLSKMSSVHDEFVSWGQGQIDGAKASRLAKEIWELGDKEGYWSERGRLAADVTHIAAAHSDKRAVVAWAKLARTWYAIELGNDSSQVLEMQSLLQKPPSHFSWATRYPQGIELPSDMS